MPTVPTLLPALATWVVPTVLGALALLLSAVLVVLTRRRRLAAVALLDLDDLEQEDATDPAPRPATGLSPSLEGWDGERLPSTEVRPATTTDLPAATVPPPRAAEPAAPAAAPAPVTAGTAPVVEGPLTAYVALSRDLAAAGDVTGAVLAQWAADLQVLRPALGSHGPDLARAVDAVRHDDPVVALRTCREAALGLVRAAGPVRALLAPLDHLVDAPATGRDAAPALPPALLALLPAEQAERLRGPGTGAAPGMTA